MFRIDVYGQNPNPNKRNNKLLGSHWYETLDEAENAKFALIHMPRRAYTFQPGENREIKTVFIGGYHVKGPVEDNKY